jgi:hypothetical protein
MDKIPHPAEFTLLHAAVAAAQAHGITLQIVQKAPKPGDTHPAALLRLEHGGQEVLYIAEIKAALRPATLGATLLQLERLGQQALLVTDHITPALADELKARRIAFLDTAGNAYFDQAPLLIWIKGQKPDVKPKAPLMGRAFQPTSLQVLFAMLCMPEAINQPYRRLAVAACVAHGTVGWVMQDLQQLGFVRDLKGKRGTRRLFQKERLLNQWTDAYARTLRPRTLIGRYFVPTIQDWKDWPVAEHNALWGGEPAAALLTGYLRPGELTLYAEQLPGLMAARLKFKQEPAPGHIALVEVRRKFWNFPGDPAHPDLVPALLTYADLLATGDARCIETARLVYDGHIARLIEPD